MVDNARNYVMHRCAALLRPILRDGLLTARRAVEAHAPVIAPVFAPRNGAGAGPAEWPSAARCFAEGLTDIGTTDIAEQMSC